jgi:hypothetical protein
MTTEVKERSVQDWLFEKVGYDPTQGGRNKYQPKIVSCTKRFELVAGGEQAGKSEVASKVFLTKWFDDQVQFEGEYGDGSHDPLLYWLIGAAYGETIKEFTYIHDDLIALGQPVKASKRVDPGTIILKFPGEYKPRLRIETKSATDITKMSKDAPHGIIICEADQVGLIVFERAQGRLTPHNGWLFMCGTFEKSIGWYPMLWESWKSGTGDRQSFSLPSYSNYFLYPGGRNDPKILELERNSSDQFFMERIEGRPVPPRGLVFKEFRADIHIQDCAYVPGEKVYIGEDPGYGAKSAHAVEVCQIIDGQVRVFDELYYRGLTTEEIVGMVMKRPWWKEKGGAGIFLTSDPYYRSQHHSMTSVEEQWLDQANLVSTGGKIRVNEGDERLKQFLKPDPFTGRPGIVFSPYCSGILSEFGAMPHPLPPYEGQTMAYSWKMDKDGNVIGDTPESLYNHGIRGIEYFLVDRYGYGAALGNQVVKMKRW